MLNQKKQEYIDELNQRVEDKILNKANADFLAKLIHKADSLEEVQAIMALGTTYKRTGFHFDFRKEPACPNIKYLKKNDKLSFVTDKDALTHKLIIGDNYDALRQLLITHRGLIDVIYIDPPYGKNDMGKFADTNYTNAITRDNLLSMLYTRLQLAKELLSYEGVIFCSIDDKNHAYVKCLFDEIFGEAGFVASFVVTSAPAGSQSSTDYAIQHSYCLCYKKPDFKSSNLSSTAEFLEEKYMYEDENGRYYLERLWKRGIGGRKEDVPSLHFPVYYDKETKTIYVDEEIESVSDRSNIETIIPYQTVGVLGRWTWSKKKMFDERHLLFCKETSGEWKLYRKAYESEDKGKKMYSIIPSSIGRTEIGSLELKNIMNAKVFDYPKSSVFIKQLLKISTKESSIVLDFFAGSGTTGHAVLDLNKEDGGSRQFILCTNNEITSANPTGIAYDVTAKRLKRIMTGQCYNGTNNFKWLENNKPYGDNLEVTEIAEISPTVSEKDNTPFDLIDESLYGILPFDKKEDKINWICTYFKNTMKGIESDKKYCERWGE